MLGQCSTRLLVNQPAYTGGTQLTADGFAQLALPRVGWQLAPHDGSRLFRIGAQLGQRPVVTVPHIVARDEHSAPDVLSVVGVRPSGGYALSGCRAQASAGQ